MFDGIAWSSSLHRLQTNWTGRPRKCTGISAPEQDHRHLQTIVICYSSCVQSLLNLGFGRRRQMSVSTCLATRYLRFAANLKTRGRRNFPLSQLVPWTPSCRRKWNFLSRLECKFNWACPIWFSWPWSSFGLTGFHWTQNFDGCSKPQGWKIQCNQ